MVSGLHSCRHFVRAEHGSDRDAACEAFREGHDIRFDAVILIGEELARTPDAALDFIEDEQCMMLVAERADFLQVAVIRCMDTALALDGLEHDRTGLVAHGFLKLIDIVVVDIGEAARHGAEALLVVRLARGRERRVGAAVETHAGRDNLNFLRILRRCPFAGNLDCAFIRLSTGVAEKSLAQPRKLHELCRSIGACV